MYTIFCLEPVGNSQISLPWLWGTWKHFQIRRDIKSLQWVLDLPQNPLRVALPSKGRLRRGIQTYSTLPNNIQCRWALTLLCLPVGDKALFFISKLGFSHSKEEACFSCLKKNVSSYLLAQSLLFIRFHPLLPTIKNMITVIPPPSKLTSHTRTLKSNSK